MHSSDGGLLCLLSVVYSVLSHFVVCAVCTLRSMPSGCSAVRVLRACLRGRSVAGVGCVGGVGSIVYVLCTCCRLCASCRVLHPTHRTHSALNPSYTQTAEHHRAGGDAASSQHSPICTAHGTHTYTHHASYITQHTSHKDKTNNKYMRSALPTHSTQG